MKKQFVLSVITVMLLLILFGCNIEHVDPGTSGESNQPIVTTVPGETTKTPTSAVIPEFTHPPVSLEPDPPVSDEEMNITVQYLPETVENPDNLPVLKWLCLVNKSSQTWTEDAVHELNQMLADRNMPFRLQFIILTTTQSYSRSDWFSRPEVKEAVADADLIFGRLTYEERINNLLPITKYVTGEAQPSLENAVLHKLNWNSVSTNGEIYGIPTWPLQSKSNGWAIDPNILSEYGLTVADFNRNYWEMDEIFAEIYKANGSKPFLSLDNDGYNSTSGVNLNTMLPSAVYDMLCNGYDLIGAYFGVDYSAEVPTIVNTLETNYARNVWAAAIRYRDAGYVVKDEKETPPQIYYGETYGDIVYVYKDRLLCIPVTPVTFDSHYASHYISGIASEAQHIEEAITLLNLIAEDEAFQTQLFFGKEGRDYTLTNGVYSSIRQENGAYYNMDYLSVYSYFSSISEKGRGQSLIAHEGKTKLQTYLDNLDSVQFCEYPIIFDYSGFEDELDAIAEICNTYYFFFTNDTEIGEPDDPDYKPRMTEELYDQMLQELKDAGSDKIIAELQRQLDEWLAENPDWQ